ncbi:MAG: N-acetyl sugar amidotransferase [Nitrospina sp.]|nr:N-acetyl sugar amidotransferase [Nitrospina sp.]
MTTVTETVYHICTRCILDTSDRDIEFDDNGVCNHCREFDTIVQNRGPGSEQSQKSLETLCERIRAEGEGKPYDCLVGLSGGVDSSYVAYLAKQYRLRPLAVHFDNGWNSELAVKNIHRIVSTLEFDLQTYVIDWEEFRDLQRSFIKAGVIDIEMLTDHAIFASLFRISRENDIKYILSGVNVATESGMPRSWTWFKQDFRNIKAIHDRFGDVRLKTFPRVGTLKWLYLTFISRDFYFVDILNYVNYEKEKAMTVLEDKLGWQYYGGKHYESLFTQFYQAYILPEKFKVDKRRVHLSSLIRNGEITRDEALQEMEKPLYDPKLLKAHKEYVLKKLGFSEEEFGRIMREPPRDHDFYPTSQSIIDVLKKIKKMISPGSRKPSN